MSYSLSDYGAMVADDVRTGAYLAALERHVRPGSVVLDVGTGAGIFALAACRLGARRVHAVETSDAIEVARRLAAENGWADRIAFHQQWSTRLELSEPADVVVGDIGGVLPLYDRSVSSWIDARTRLLRPGGVLVPRCDQLMAAVVEAPDAYRSLVGVWENERFGLDLSAGRTFVLNQWSQRPIRGEALLTEPAVVATLDYRRIETTDVSVTMSWEIERAGTAHGLAVWFDRELTDGVRFSTRPRLTSEAPWESVYGTAFFPWSEPVSLAPVDRVSARLQARDVGGDYVWRWDTDVEPADAAGRARHFVQSTFFAAPLSPAKVRARSETFAPVLNEEGRFTRRALSLMDGDASLGQLAVTVHQEFPERFPTPVHALDALGKLSLKYGR